MGSAKNGKGAKLVHPPLSILHKYLEHSFRILIGLKRLLILIVGHPSEFCSWIILCCFILNVFCLFLIILIIF